MTLTNMVTTESHALPNGCWQAFYSDDGVGGCLVRQDVSDAGDGSGDGNAETMDVDDILKKRLYVSDDGERYIFINVGEHRRQRYSLDANLSKFMEADLSIKVGCIAARGRLGTCIMQLSRNDEQLSIICFKKTRLNGSAIVRLFG